LPCLPWPALGVALFFPWPVLASRTRQSSPPWLCMFGRLIDTTGLFFFLLLLRTIQAAQPLSSPYSSSRWVMNTACVPSWLARPFVRLGDGFGSCADARLHWLAGGGPLPPSLPPLSPCRSASGQMWTRGQHAGPPRPRHMFCCCFWLIVILSALCHGVQHAVCHVSAVPSLCSSNLTSCFLYRDSFSFGRRRPGSPGGPKKSFSSP
jgi:hypothetical protein